MNDEEMVKWIDKNLSIELECMHTDFANNQTIQARLKIGDVVISKSDCEVLVNETN